MTFMPMVLEREGGSERAYDLPSRMMKDRIVYLGGAVDERMAHVVTMQLLYLESVNNKKPINLYISSPGGSVLSGLQIVDTMNTISCPIITVATGLAMSMGSYILSAGTKGKRFATETCRIMCHAVSSGMQGVIHDMEVSFNETKYLDNMLAENLARNCGKTLEEYRRDTQRDFFMSPQEAVEYGLIDAVVPRKPKIEA